MSGCTLRAVMLQCCKLYRSVTLQTVEQKNPTVTGVKVIVHHHVQEKKKSFPSLHPEKILHIILDDIKCRKTQQKEGKLCSGNLAYI